MKRIYQRHFLLNFLLLTIFITTALLLTGCSSVPHRRIVRIGHNQSTNHPTHIALTAFQNYINEHLGDRYIVEVYPSELLGSQTDMVQLTQTGAIDFCVASNSILETFSENYTLFNLPYLFASQDAYHAAMDDSEIVDPIFESTAKAGFEAVTWIDAGTRNFYTVSTPINTPADLKGLKIRVQQSPASVGMAQAFGAAASPMSFGEVYTAIQQGVIDGAENNELALTNNKHGEVAKYYTYNKHQMVPDMLIGNLKFLEGLSDEEREIFEKAAEISTEVEMEAWDEQVEEAKKIAQDEMGVEFIEVDTELFREKVLTLQQEMLEENPNIRELYDHIQTFNEKFDSAGAQSTEVKEAQ